MPKHRPLLPLFVYTLKHLLHRVFFAVWHRVILTPVIGSVFLYARATRAYARSTRARRLLATALLVVAIVGAGLSLNTSFGNQPRAVAATSDNLNFQARLEGSNGAIAPDGNYNIQFKVYNASTGGSALWTESYLNSASQGVRVVNGYVTVNLGSVTAFPSNLSWDQNLYITMNIGGTGTGTPSYDGEMNPRLKLTAVPYAFQAKSATQLQATNGSNVATLSFTAPTANNSILLPDASGTVCLAASTACGFATSSGSGSYIQNGTTLQSNANLKIRSAATGTATGIIQALTGQTADLLSFVAADGTTPLSGFNAAGQLYYQSGSYTGALALAALGQNTVYTLPDPGRASDTVCLLTLANCTGTGGGIAGSGSQYYLAKFDTAGGNHVGNSSLYDNGSFLGLNTTTNNGLLSVVGASATQSSLFVQGVASATASTAVLKAGASQTAALLELQYSNGATAAKFGAGGEIQTNGLATIGSISNLTGSPQLGVKARADNVVGEVIQANSATQTAALLEFRNSAGTVLAKFDAAGNLITNDGTFNGNISQIGAGTFSTGSGNVLLNGNTSITGVNTLTVGTGLTSLGGALNVVGLTTLSSALTVNSTAYINTNSTTAFKVEQAGVNNSTFVVDTANARVGIGGVTTSGYALTVNGSQFTTGASIISTNSSNAFRVQSSTNSQQTVNINNTSAALLSNPDFESNTTGWSNRAGGALSRITTPVTGIYYGNAAAQVVTTATAGAGLSYTYALAPSTQYTLSFFARASGSSFSTLSFGRQEVSGTDIDCATTQTVSTNGFTRYSCTFTTGATITSSNIYVKQSDATARTFYVDAFQLETAATASAYKQATISLRGTFDAAAVFQSGTDSTTAFQIQNAAGTGNNFVVDTTNGVVGVGQAPVASGAILQVGGSFSTTGAATIGGALTVAGSIAATGNISGSTFVSTGLAAGFRIGLSNNDAGGISKSAVTNSAVSVGDVVVLDSTGKAARTTTMRDSRVYGVAGTAVASGGTTVVVIVGSATVNADTSAVAIGDQLVTSTTGGAVTVDNNATTGILGYATSAKAAGSAGTVGVRIQIENGQTDPNFNGNVGVGGALTVSGTGTSVFTGSVQGANAAANNQFITLGQANTLYATSGGSTSSYIQNSTSTQAAANFNIVSAATGSIAAVIQGASGGTADILNVRNGAGNNVFSIGSAGATALNTSSTTALKVGDASGSTALQNTFVVDTVNGAVSVGAASATAGYRLQVSGAAYVTGNLTTGGTLTTTNLIVSSTTKFNGSGDSATIGGSGNLFKNTTDSTNAFEIQNAAATSNLFIADTTNSKIGIGAAPSSAGATLQVTGTFSSTGNITTSGGITGNALSLSAQASAVTGFDINNTSLSNGMFDKRYVQTGTSVSDVVILNASGQVVRTTTPRDPRILGVAATLSQVAIAGNTVVTADTSSAIAIGDQLVTSATAGAVVADNNATTGILGYATTAKAAGTAGTVGVTVRIVSGQYAPRFQNATDSTTAFQIQNAAGTGNNFVVDTTNNIVSVGGTLNVQGSGTSVFTGSVQGANAVANNQFVTLGQANSLYAALGGSAGSYIQNSATAQSGANFNIISAVTTSIAAVIQGASSGTVDILNVRNGAGTNVFSVGLAGATAVSSSSTTAFKVGDASSGTASLQNLLVVDTVNGRVGIGTATPSAGYSLTTAGGIRAGANISTSAGVYANNVNAVNFIASGTSSFSGSGDSSTVAGSGNLFQNTTNSTNAFEIQNATATSNLFIADTTNSKIGIGMAPSSSGATLQVGTGGISTTGAGTIGSTLTANGTALFQNTTNGAAAFSIQDSAGTGNIFNVNTTSRTIGIGTNAVNNARLTVDATANGGSSSTGPAISAIQNSVTAAAISATNSGGPAISATSSTGTAISASGSSGNGINAGSSFAYGLVATSRSSGAALFQQSSTNSSDLNKPTVEIQRITTGSVNATTDILKISDATTTTGTVGGNLINALKNTTSVFTVGNTGALLSQNSVNSTTAFQIQNAAGTNLFTVDSTNQQLAVGPAAVPANGVLTIGTNTTTASGGLYFGTDNNIYRSGVSSLSTNSSFFVSSGSAGNVLIGGSSVPVIRLGNSASATIAGTSSNQNGVVITGTTSGVAALSVRSYSNSAGNIFTAVNPNGTVATIGATGDTTFQSYTNGATAFQLKDSTGSAYLVGNSTNQQLSVGAGASPANGVLTVGTNTTTASGGLYFGTDTSLYRSAAGQLQTGGNLVVQGSATSVFTGSVQGADATASNQFITLGQANGLYTALGGTPGSYIQNGTTAQSSSFYVQASSSSTVAGIVQGVSGQTVDIFRAIKLDGNGLTISQTGNVTASSGITAANGGNNTVAALRVTNTGLTTVEAATFTGVSGQTANIASFRSNGGTVLSSITAAGALQGGNAGGTDATGASISINGGQGTGAGAGGNITFGIFKAGTTGSANNTSVSNALTISGSDGSAVFRGAANATAAFQIQNASGTNLLGVDTTNSRTTLGGSVLLQNTAGSSSAFQVQNAAGANVINVDTTNNLNLLANGGFEVDASGWVSRVSSTISRVTTPVYEGLGAGSIVTAASANSGAQYAYALASNTDYTLSFYAMIASGTFTTMSAGYNNGSSSTACFTNRTVVTTGWTRFSCSFTTGTVSGSPYLFISQGNDSTARTLYVDDMQLQLGSIVTPYATANISINGVITSPLSLNNTTDSTSALQVTNTSGKNVLTVNTINNYVDVLGQLRFNDGNGNFAVLKSNGGTTLYAPGNFSAGSFNSFGTIQISSTGGNVANSLKLGGIGPASEMGLQIGDPATTDARLYRNAASGLKSDSTLTLQNATNSTAAFQVQNVAGQSQLTVDTTNGLVSISGSLNVNLAAVTSSNAVCFTGGTNNVTGVKTLTDCSGAPVADYAENYPVAASAAYGDIVAIGSTMVNTYDVGSDGNVDWTKLKGQVTQLTKTLAPYQTNTIGVVSDNHNDFTSTGNNIKPEDNPMPVALNGRVPVNVAPGTPAIAPGDYVTTSTIAGKAMKATGAGYVIGKALSAWDPASGAATVMIFVEPGFYLGPNASSYLQNDGSGTLSNLNVTGTADFNDLNVSGKAVMTDLQVVNVTVTGNLTVMGLVSVVDLQINGHVITRGTAPAVAAAMNAGTGALCTVSGNDTAGQITIKTGSAGQTAGSQCALTFAKAFDGATHPVIAPAGGAGATTDVSAIKPYVDATATGFQILFNAPDSGNHTYIFNYFNAQ